MKGEGMKKEEIMEQLNSFINDLCLEYMEDTETEPEEIERRLSVEDVAGTVDELAATLARIFD